MFHVKRRPSPPLVQILTLDPADSNYGEVGMLARMARAWRHIGSLRSTLFLGTFFHDQSAGPSAGGTTDKMSRLRKSG